MAADFERLKAAARTLLWGDKPWETRLQRVCELLRAEAPGYDWVGFYVVDAATPDELVLGPFAGAPTEHVRIPFGRGICGQAAAREDVVVVADVTRETNYLACSATVRAEIVLPIWREGRLWGELDVDSHEPAAFGDDDRRFLEGICALVSEAPASP